MGRGGVMMRWRMGWRLLGALALSVGLIAGYDSQPAEAQVTFTQITSSTGSFDPDWGIPLRPSINADGTRIAFTSARDLTGGNSDGNNEIFLWTEGAVPPFTQITNTTGDNHIYLVPSINADGTKIAFHSKADLTGGNPDGIQEIFLWTEGAVPPFTQITNPGTLRGGWEPSISADGTRIAFISGEDLPGSVRNVFLWTSGSGFTKITTSTNERPNPVYFPSISADGTRIAFISVISYDWKIALWTQESGITQIIARIGGLASFPSISADGTRIAFESSGKPIGDADRKEIFLWTSGSSITPITTDTAWPIYNTQPSISADGTKIAFASTRDLTGGNPDHSIEIFLATLSSDPPPPPPTNVPVVLVHGWCGDPTSFGNMAQYLGDDLHVIANIPFDYSGDSSLVSSRKDREDLKRLASRLANHIRGHMALIGADTVDVVAHSMGGLLTRAWMAGLTDIPYSGEIRRLVLAGTPNFGVSNGVASPPGCSERPNVAAKQRSQMAYGSKFLVELNQAWEKKVNEGSISPPDIMTVVGCGLFTSDGECVTDHVVQAGSATLPMAEPDYLVRHVKRDHVFSLVDIESRDHETYKLVEKFLETGDADSFYNASQAKGFIVVPLVKDASTLEPFTTRNGIDFGKSTVYGDRLPHCGNPLLSSPFELFKPSESTGWWSLTDVHEACLEVQVKARKYLPSTLAVTVTAGRPIITGRVVMVPK